MPTLSRPGELNRSAFLAALDLNGWGFLTLTFNNVKTDYVYIPTGLGRPGLLVTLAMRSSSDSCRRVSPMIPDYGATLRKCWAVSDANDLPRWHTKLVTRPCPYCFKKGCSVCYQHTVLAAQPSALDRARFRMYAHHRQHAYEV